MAATLVCYANIKERPFLLNGCRVKDDEFMSKSKKRKSTNRKNTYKKNIQTKIKTDITDSSKSKDIVETEIENNTAQGVLAESDIDEIINDQTDDEINAEIEKAEEQQNTTVDEAIEKEISKVKKSTNTSETSNTDEIEIEFIDLEKKKSKKRKITSMDIVRYAVMLIALCTFSYASYELTLIHINAQETTEASKKEADILKVDIDDSIDYYNANGEKIVLNNSGDGKAFVWDFEKIKAYNHNAKGYIRQGKGTYIDNPVVQHPSNNEYYLEHYSNDYPNGIGSIFIDYRIKDGLNAKNCILYGHNVKAWANHIMFGSLNFYYDDPQYGKDNPTMDIYVDEHHYVYYVYAIFKAEAKGDPVYTWEFENSEAFMKYVNKNKARTKYEFPDAPAITPESKILTLSTCTTDHDYRMIVQLVRGEEIFDVPVKETNE